MNTVVKCTCTAIKTTPSYQTEHPVNFQIELTIPYGSDSIYYQLSGGTGITLNTVNEEAAKMFVLEGKYKIDISPVGKE